MTSDNRVRKPLPLPSTYDRHRVSAGIAHLGVGNFHRAHQAWYVDRCLAQHGHENWGILGIGLLDVPGERAKADAFRRQGGLYSLTICPPEGQSDVFVIGSIVEYLHAPDDPGAVLERLSDPAIKIVTLTVTEGGYNLDEAGRFRIEAPGVVADLTGDRPGTWFGLVTEALRRRWEAGTGPFAVMSVLPHPGVLPRCRALPHLNVPLAS
jgi:mannitol 2-dehydrogenase